MNFVSRLNKESLLYWDEVIALLAEYEMGSYIPAVIANGMYRWYPSEVLALIAQEDAYIASDSPVVDASEKHIPEFLLK